MNAREIAQSIARRIEENEWPRVGSDEERQLPTREQLKTEYSSSLSTIDGAIRLLRVWGLVVTRRRGGTYTRPPKPERINIPGDDGTWTRSDSAMEMIGAFSWLKDSLGVSEEDEVFRTREVLSRNGEVCAILDTYSVEGWTRAEAGVETNVADRVRTWLPSDEEAQILGMPQEVPVLALLSEADGMSMVRIFPGDRIEYRS